MTHATNFPHHREIDGPSSFTMTILGDTVEYLSKLYSVYPNALLPTHWPCTIECEYNDTTYMPRIGDVPCRSAD